jgi:hypothetical protein
LVGMLLDLDLVASLETVSVGAVGVVLVGGDIGGFMLALLSISINLDRNISRTLLLAEETHLGWTSR